MDEAIAGLLALFGTDTACRKTHLVTGSLVQMEW